METQAEQTSTETQPVAQPVKPVHNVRRQFTEADKFNAVEEVDGYVISGKTKDRACELTGITSSQYYSWRKSTKPVAKPIKRKVAKPIKRILPFAQEVVKITPSLPVGACFCPRCGLDMGKVNNALRGQITP